MRIGVVTTSYPRWPGDPAGSFVEGHVRALRRLGHEVEIVAAGDGHDVVRVPAAGLFYGGGAPDTFERAPWRTLRAATSFLPRFATTIARRARHWDHIVAHWLPTALAALPARKPMTAIAHGGDVYTLHRTRLLQPTLRALRHAHRVFVGEHLRALANDDGIVQPMGLDLAHFRALGRAPTTPPTILIVARLVPIKGIDVAVEADARLRGARLVIAGDGPERRALEARALANAARGAPPVTFLGHVDTQRRDELLREASVVVVPSRVMPNGRTEGCPTIALEALAAGVPVVATIGRASRLVPPDDAPTLAHAIEAVLADRAVPTSELVADLDWDRVVNRLLRK